MAEHSSNKGYLAIRAETTKGTPVGTPNVYVPIYSESLATLVGLDQDNPIVGNIFARFQTLLGKRSHGGEIQFLAEPNTMAHLFNMFMTKQSTSGSDPYTHTFEFDRDSNPKSYTIDIQKGQIVTRFSGAEASMVSNEFDESKMTVNMKISALKSFIVRSIASIANTYEIIFNTDYDSQPTDLLVAGDLVRIQKADGTVINTTISTVDSVTQITVADDVSSASANDLFHIRPATSPSYSVKTPFNFTRGEWRYGADAAAALAATQTRLDDGSWELTYSFQNDKGEQRTGNPDPETLVRIQGNAELSVKKYFDLADDYHASITNKKDTTLVIRYFSETGYELRITVYKYAVDGYEPGLQTAEAVMADFKYLPEYSDSDGKAIKVEIINALSTI